MRLDHCKLLRSEKDWALGPKGFSVEAGTVGLGLVRYQGQCGTKLDPVRCECGTKLSPGRCQCGTDSGPWAGHTEGASLLGSLTRLERSRENTKR